MSAIRQVFLIAWRDFLQRARRKAFMVSMLVVVAMVALVGPLIASENRAPKPYRIGVVGTSLSGLEQALDPSATAFDRAVTVGEYGSINEGETALADGDADVLLVDGARLVWNEKPNLQLAAIITSAVRSISRSRTIADLGLTAQEAARLLSQQPLDSTSLIAPAPTDTPKRIAGYAGSLLLYISILMFGQFVMLGVMEEKQSRVVEVVLSRTRPSRLLAGKVI